MLANLLLKSKHFFGISGSFDCIVYSNFSCINQSPKKFDIGFDNSACQSRLVFFVTFHSVTLPCQKFVVSLVHPNSIKSFLYDSVAKIRNFVVRTRMVEQIKPSIQTGMNFFFRLLEIGQANHNILILPTRRCKALHDRQRIRASTFAFQYSRIGRNRL